MSKEIEKDFVPGNDPFANFGLIEDMEAPDRLPTLAEHNVITETCDALKNMSKEELNTIAQDIVDNLRADGVEIPDDEANEGLLGTAFGLATGALAGPAVGRAVARGLGIEKGILFNLLTSRLVGAAIGSEIMKLI